MIEDVIKTSRVDIIMERLAVLKMPVGARIESDVFLVARDGEETTVILGENQLKELEHVGCHRNFRALRVNVSAPFAAPGFLASICKAIASDGTNVFVISTFSCDYVLVREQDLDSAVSSLESIGFPVEKHPIPLLSA